MWKIAMEDAKYNRLEFCFNDLVKATEFVSTAISKNPEIKATLELVEKGGGEE